MEKFFSNSAPSHVHKTAMERAFSQAFVMEKDSKRFPKTGGWGYALFNYDTASDSLPSIPAPQTAETHAIRP
jgi:Cytochrome P460